MINTLFAHIHSIDINYSHCIKFQIRLEKIYGVKFVRLRYFMDEGIRYLNIPATGLT